MTLVFLIKSKVKSKRGRAFWDRRGACRRGQGEQKGPFAAQRSGAALDQLVPRRGVKDYLGV